MTKIVGHRGARNKWPENSIEGFRKTLELPVDAIEFDVHLTDAGELVVIHDATLERTTEKAGKVRALSPSDHQATRLKGSQESIPTLDEVLALFASSRPVELHVELKADADGAHYEGLEALAAAAIRRHGLAERSLLTSFNLGVLARCQQIAPEIGRLCSINAKSAEALGAAATFTKAAEVAGLVAIEKSLLAATRPKLLVCDEPVSALDVSIQAQIINMLRDLQQQHGIAMVFISHDLKVVRNMADKVAVMYLGRVVEEASADVIFHSPMHPYTRALVSSVPRAGIPLQGRTILQGEPPNPANRPSGCAFHPRCPLARDRCRIDAPQLKTIGHGRTVACHVTAGEDARIAA